MRSRTSSDVELARSFWGNLSQSTEGCLRRLVERYRLSVALGDLQLLDGRWYVTHAGLLRLAHHRRCRGIRTVVDGSLSAPTSGRWVVKAIVYRSDRCKGFAGYGDADPSNVSALVRGAELRVAETRAVNRALRKAYGIGICSVEELGWVPRTPDPDLPSTNGFRNLTKDEHTNGQPRLRDRLCLLIRQHRLEPNLVKAYAADYCGTAALRDATRDQIEAFVDHLAERAKNDRGSLLDHLNSYSRSEEVAK